MNTQTVNAGDHIYQIQSTETGDHILIYGFDGVDYVFEHKIVVDASEFRS